MIYRNYQFAALLLFIPFLLEATFIPAAMIEIPGSPLTLGRLCLVGLGVVGLRFWDFRRRQSPMIHVLLLLVVGTALGTLFSSDLGEDLSALIGFSLLFGSAASASSLLRFEKVRLLLHVFIVVFYAYWILFVFQRTITGQGLVTYGEIYRASRTEDLSLVNYHAFGLFLSSAILYLDLRYKWLKTFNLSGIAILILGIGAIFITESRSNLLITLVCLLYFYIRVNRLGLFSSMRILTFAGVFAVVAVFFMGQNERLEQRYDLRDTLYIEQTTEARTVFVALTFEHLKEFPFGRGPTNNRVNFFGANYQPHNQYLTFMLFSGYVGLVAVLFWLGTTWWMARRAIKEKRGDLLPYLGVVVVTMLVMFTNDLSGAFLFLMLMIQGWIAAELTTDGRLTAMRRDVG